MASINKIVAVLVIWAVCVTTWMMVLSTNGSWGNCADDQARASLRDNVEPGLLYAASARSAHHETTPQLPSKATTKATIATPDPVLERRLYYSQLMGSSTSDQENCTAVILTYSHMSLLPKVLNHYCKMPLFKRILVVWNNVNVTISPSLKIWERRCTHLKFIFPGTNKLMNRYLPWKEIETDCVCLFEDDHIVSIYDMEFGYEVWQNFRHLLVGFYESSFIKNPSHGYIYAAHESRRYIGLKHKTVTPSNSKIEIKNGARLLHVGNKTYNLGKYEDKRKPSDSNTMEEADGYSIMQSPCFVHKAYLEMYFDPLMIPAGAVEYVEKQKNCEDILLSIVVTKFLQDMNMTQSGVMVIKNSLPIKILEEPRHTVKGTESESESGLSKKYFHERSECLNVFSKLYGYLPLRLSNNIATLV